MNRGMFRVSVLKFGIWDQFETPGREASYGPWDWGVSMGFAFRAGLV